MREIANTKHSSWPKEPPAKETPEARARRHAAEDWADEINSKEKTIPRAARPVLTSAQVKELTDLWEYADETYPGRKTNAPLDSRTIEDAKEELEQEKKEMMESLEKAHRRHAMAPLEFNCLNLPRYSTRDHLRRYIYFHEFLLVKMDNNKDLNYISSGLRADWAEEWTNEMSWMPATRHLNRTVDNELPFCKMMSPEFRCWWLTEGRHVSEDYWISLEQQRQYNHTIKEGWKGSSELKTRCRRYNEIADVKNN